MQVTIHPSAPKSIHNANATYEIRGTNNKLSCITRQMKRQQTYKEIQMDIGSVKASPNLLLNIWIHAKGQHQPST
jgi:hypothetical protein